MAYVRKETKISRPKPSEQEFNTPDELIELAKQKGIETEPLNVCGLTRELGIPIDYEPMETEESGSLYYNKSDSLWRMRINSLHHPNRQRFTIAHELGHYVKHRAMSSEFKDKSFFRNGETNRMETEANRFAGELLMPKEAFLRSVDIDPEISSIAEHFQVSSMAVRVRAKQLGLKGHNL